MDWIKLSERTPDKTGLYLVTIHSISRHTPPEPNDGEKYETHCAEYYDSAVKRNPNTWGVRTDGVYPLCNGFRERDIDVCGVKMYWMCEIVAWAEMPAPYQTK